MGFRFFGLGSNNSVIFLSCIFIMSGLRTPIVAQVDALMSFCDSLEQLVGKQALLSERLMQSAVREVLS
jgi:hypothetical protein